MYSKIKRAAIVCLAITHASAVPHESEKHSYYESVPDKMAPPVPTAPPMVEKSVLEMIPPSLMCPPNYYLFKGKCVQLIKKPVDFRCSKGYELSRSQEGVECVKSTAQPPKLMCDEGFTQHHDVCTRMANTMPEYRCPPNYTLTNRKCVSSLTIPAIEKCSEDYRLVNDECVRLVSTNPTFYCESDGFKLDKEILRCVGVEWTPLQYVCPSGTVPGREGICAGNEQTAPQNACPPDTTQEGESCVAEDKFEVTGVCDGSDPMMDENCVVEKVEPPVPRCPSGYEKNPATGKCETKVVAPVEQMCLQGILDTSVMPPRCVFQQSTLPALLCPDEYEKIDNYCVRRTEHPVQPACQTGFTLVENVCEKPIEKAVESFCPAGFEARDSSCVKPTFENAKRMCPPGFQYKFGGCTTIEKSPIKHTCDAGFELQLNNKCQLSEYLDPEPSCTCANCVLSDGKCVFNEVQHPKILCKEPFHLNPETNLCEHAQAKSPDAYCPSGFKYSGGTRPLNKAVCTKTESLDPKPICDKGLFYDRGRNACISDAHVKHVPFEVAEGKSTGHERTKSHDSNHGFLYG